MDAAELQAHADKKQAMLLGMAGQYSNSGHAVRKASGHKKGIGGRSRGKNSASSVSLRGGAAARGHTKSAGSARLFGESVASPSSLTALADGGAALARTAISGGPDAQTADDGHAPPPLSVPASPVMSGRKAAAKRAAGVARSASRGAEPAATAAPTSSGTDAEGGAEQSTAGRAARVKQLNQKRAVQQRAVAATTAPRRTHGWLGLKGNECNNWRRLYAVLRGARLLGFSEEAVRRCCGARALRPGAPIDDARLEEAQAEAEFALSGGSSVARMMTMVIIRPAGVAEDDDDAEGCWIVCIGSEGEAEQWRASVSDAIDTAKYVERHMAKSNGGGGGKRAVVAASASSASAAVCARKGGRPEL